MITIGQLSDTHIDGTAGATEKATRVVEYLRRLAEPVAAIVVTGDITDHGEAHEYAIAARVLSADVPVLFCPGNHDERRAFATVLLGRPGARTVDAAGAALPIDQALALPGLLLLACDSSVPGEVSGRLGQATLAWLRTQLAAAAGVPTIIALHHPPAPPTLPGHPPGHVDLADPGRLETIVRENPQVVAVLAGHLHAGSLTTFAGRPLVVAPAVYSQLQLPGVPGPLYDRGLPPALTLHTLDDTGRLTTHMRVIA